MLQGQQRAGSVLQAVDDRLPRGDPARTEPARDPALELRPQILVIADDEAAQGQPLEDRLDQLVDVGGPPLPAELRHHAAQGDPAPGPQRVQGGGELLPATRKSV
ncbi:hypothetical protein [Streptomyces sp. NL15-2K]|uniref:hypothetical protein n=1 Tax=Streptomyces sp. NL15-2K TaxID=376149 RepID=UPI00155AFDE7|nr:hypothetical protein [Streptomyces sp. NL15-2K]